MDGDGDAPRVVDDVDEFVLLLLLFALATVLLPVAVVALFLFLTHISKHNDPASQVSHFVIVA